MKFNKFYLCCWKKINLKLILLIEILHIKQIKNNKLITEMILTRKIYFYLFYYNYYIFIFYKSTSLM